MGLLYLFKSDDKTWQVRRCVNDDGFDIICKEAVAGAGVISRCLPRRADETAKPHPTETTSQTKIEPGTS
jgi:hypothetical protein